MNRPRAFPAPTIETPHGKTASERTEQSRFTHLGLMNRVHGVLDRELFKRGRRVAAAAFPNAWRAQGKKPRFGQIGLENGCIRMSTTQPPLMGNYLTSWDRNQLNHQTSGCAFGGTNDGRTVGPQANQNPPKSKQKQTSAIAQVWFSRGTHRRCPPAGRPDPPTSTPPPRRPW